jgi:phage-related minor tail protein
MILELVVNIIADIFTGLNKIIPDIPDMPTEIDTIAQTVTTTIASGWATLAGFFGAGFLFSILIIVIGIINFEHIYHLTMWVIRKLPIGTN